jgi:hypothetical protein
MSEGEEIHDSNDPLIVALGEEDDDDDGQKPGAA